MPTYLTPEQLTARNRRSLWIAIGLVAFIIVIFLSTFLRMQRNLAERAAQQQAVATQAR